MSKFKMAALVCSAVLIVAVIAAYGIPMLKSVFERKVFVRLSENLSY